MGINFIHKLDFLVSYNQFFTDTYQPDTIGNEFKATELILYNLI